MKPLLGVCALLLAGTAQAGLGARDLDGNGTTDAYYDDTLNITWMANATEAVGPRMDANWYLALVSGTYGGTWRLPTLRAPEIAGATCEGDVCWRASAAETSEVGHLYYSTLGNAAGQPLNTGPFAGLGAGFYFWSEQCAPVAFADGVLDLYPLLQFGATDAFVPDGFGSLAGLWAVADGDRGFAQNASLHMTPIPEPSTYSLLALGLTCLAFAGRTNGRLYDRRA
jgi:hypothetical protein